jgi:hypothetical protein
VREQHVLDRLVRDLADAADDVGRHHGRGLRVQHHHRVVADDDAGVGVAFGGVGVGVVAQLDEADLLLEIDQNVAKYMQNIIDLIRRDKNAVKNAKTQMFVE